MKRTTRALLTGCCLLTLCACNSGQRDFTMDEIVFAAADINQKSFGGLGVEWGTYENTDKLSEDGWNKVLEYMDRLAPARVRVMVSYDWFCTDFDNHGSTDKTQHTWGYNFANKYARNTMDILEYCQTHNIDVALGAWNVIADLDEEKDVWGMMDEVTSDIRWAKITGDFLDYLVNQRGFTCIKWFVNSNEPNYTGRKGSSKNYNNTYEIWEQGVKNVRATLDSLNLQSIGIVGGDTTGYDGSRLYLTNIAKNIRDYVGDYGCHLYLSNMAVDRGEMMNQISTIYKMVQAIDGEIGEKRPANVWEAGMLDGKTSLDSQALIDTADYAVHMADYTIQCLAAGINGICYWDFDDAMHFMYLPDSVEPKRWGMFSSLSGAPAREQALRPWFHSSAALTHLFRKGNVIYTPPQTNTKLDKTFRAIATRDPKGEHGGYVAVNAGIKPVTKTFYMSDKVAGEKIYVYYFHADTYRLGEDGYLIPNLEIDGSLNKTFTTEIPAGCALIVSNERL